MSTHSDTEHISGAGAGAGAGPPVRARPEPGQEPSSAAAPATPKKVTPVDEPQPDVEQETDCENVLLPKYHAFVTRIFGKFGHLVSRFPWLFVLFGIILAVVLNIGWYRVEKSTTITELWAYEGSRMEDERGVFESYFGGSSRTSFMLFKSTEAEGIGSAAALAEVIAALTPVLVEDSALTPNPNPVRLVVPDGTGMPYNVTSRTVCSRNPVPPIWQPGGSIANAYSQYLGCVAIPGTPPSLLSPAWGITRFPCSRATVLDCFQEGAFDYPPGMLELMQVALPAALSPSRTGCLDAIEAGVASAFGATVAAQLRAGLDGSIDAFSSFGYVGRPSFQTMTPAQITAHINAGVNNLEDQSVTIASCIGGVPCCVSWAGTRVPAELYLGVLTRDPVTNDITRIGAINNVINNNNDFYPGFASRLDADLGRTTSNDERNAIMDAYEQRYIDYVLPVRAQHASGGFVTTIEVAADRSNADIVSQATEVENELIAIGYVIMIVFTAAVLGNWRLPCARKNLVDSHSLLGLGGILAIAVATVTSYGLTSWFEIEMTPLNVNIVPFLSLGLGIDDMFVLAHTMTALEAHGTVANRMVTTFELAGPSIFLTSFSNFMAFLITSATPITVVRAFSQQLSMAVLLNFIYLLCFFAPMMVFDTKRMLDNRMDLILLKVEDSDAAGAGASPSKKPLQQHDVRRITTDQLARLSVRDDVNPLTVFVRKFYGPILMYPITKVLVLIGFGLLFGFLTHNALENTDIGIRPSDIALDDSYQSEFLNFQEEEFPTYSAVIVSVPVDFPKAQSGLLMLQDAIQEDYWVVKSLRISQSSWLNSLLTFANGNIPSDTPLSEAAFYPTFVAWATSTGAVYSDNMSCRNRVTGVRVECSAADSDTELVATYVSVVERELRETPQFLDQIENQREAADLFNDLDAPNSANFVYGYTFLFWEQYVHIEDDLYRIGAFSLLGVFIGTLVFQMSPVASLILVCVMIMIDFEIYGIIDVVGAQLNGFSMSNLVMSIGLAVEFTAHVTRSFLVATGTRNQRVQAALEEMFTPVTYGALSSFLPIIPIAFAEFPFFRRYYFGMFSFMILFAYINGVVLLPVILSIIGPKSLPLPRHTIDFDAKKENEVAARSTRVLVEMSPLADESKAESNAV